MKTWQGLNAEEIASIPRDEYCFQKIERILRERNELRELSRSDVYGLAMEAGFMLSTQYGQADDKLMPVTDGQTLMNLAELILKKASEK